MAKRYACRDIGMNCDFVAQADDEQQLMQKIAEHARTAHNIQAMDPETEAKVKAAIKDA